MNRRIADEEVKNTQYTSSPSSVDFGENPLKTPCSSSPNIEETRTSVYYGLGSSMCFQNDVTINDKQEQTPDDPKVQSEEDLTKTIFRAVIPIQNKAGKSMKIIL